MSDTDVIIVGAGLAGLACATHLQREGLRVRVLEGSDGVGGRVRTDEVDGFLLDRGFQVFLTGYPAAWELLDYDRLDLHEFLPGALVQLAGRTVRMLDPSRKPSAALSTLFAKVGTLRDKLRILGLRRRSRAGSMDELLDRPESTALARLQEHGFTPGFIDAFLRPWLGGVFLDRDLETSSRMLELAIRTFAAGPVVLPGRGMGAIPAQLAAGLGDDCVRLGARVASLEEGGVRLEDGTALSANAVVVATEGPEAARLLGSEPVPSRAATCLYFDAPQDPVGERILVLDGDGTGPVNNLVVPSAVAPAYAPAGRALISASVIGTPSGSEAELESAVRNQLHGWYGAQVDDWRHLRTYVIRDALPAIKVGRHAVRRRAGLYVCGDHRESPSMQGAFASGRRCAEAVVAERGSPVK